MLWTSPSVRRSACVTIPTYADHAPSVIGGVSLAIGSAASSSSRTLRTASAIIASPSSGNR